MKLEVISTLMESCRSALARGGSGWNDPRRGCLPPAIANSHGWRIAMALALSRAENGGQGTATSKSRLAMPRLQPARRPSPCPVMHGNQPG